jgi:hypothetical protein
MPFAAKDETLSPPMMGSGEEVFFLAAALALLETHGGENRARGKKSHQGIFPRNRAIAVGSTSVKSQNPARAIPTAQRNWIACCRRPDGKE